jgi:hypothetical protein
LEVGINWSQRPQLEAAWLVCSGRSAICGETSSEIRAQRQSSRAGVMQVWLRSNPRALVAGLLPLVGAAAGSGAIVLWYLGRLGMAAALAGTALSVIGLIALGVIAAVVLQPRLAYHARHLLVGLKPGQPIQVPIEVVECFLLGTGPSWLPTAGMRERQARTLVIRLSERADEWVRRDVNPMLGAWCGSQITIRGTWCEPLSVELVRRLNERLAEAAAEPAEARA